MARDGNRNSAERAMASTLTPSSQMPASVMPASVMVSRRAMLAGFAAVGTFANLPSAAFAAPPIDPAALLNANQAEWRQSYEQANQTELERSNVPVLSQQTVAATDSAIAKYADIASRGGWPTVPSTQPLSLGTRSPAVVQLRRRLIVTGDLDANSGFSPTYDSFVQAAVKRFQLRHGLNATGVVEDETFADLNVPAAMRLRQLEVNIVRLRALSGNLGERFVMVNLPAASVETVENDVVYSHHAAGVGKIDRQSPIMSAKAVEINFNPFWTVPASIIRKDLIPKMQADPNYLTENKIRVFNKEGQEVPPRQINWNSLEATNYKFRQDTGADFNSLGFVRVNIPNQYGVYMHDTPSKGIFGDDYRFVSSGCVRIQNIREYVSWLLRDTPGWTRDQIDEAIRSGQRIDVKISQPVPVYWVYVTAWATPDGTVQFREDIYQRDGLGTMGPVTMAGPQDVASPRETAKQN